MLSKAYGLPGLRIGWAAGRDRELLTAMSRFKNYLSICCATPSEELALVALRHAPASLARNRGVVRANLALADAFFARHADLFTHNRPQAGPIGFHKIHIDGPVEGFASAWRVRPGYCSCPAAFTAWTSPISAWATAAATSGRIWRGSMPGWLKPNWIEAHAPRGTGAQRPLRRTARRFGSTVRFRPGVGAQCPWFSRHLPGI